MSLYTLTSDWLNLYNMIAEDDAEENADIIFDTIEAIEGEIEEKANGYAMVIATIEADMEAKKKEYKRLYESYKRDERSIERLKDSLKNAMKITGKTKFKTPLFSFSVAKNGGLAPLSINEGVKPSDLPEAYRKIEYKFDNDAIRKALEHGEALDFAKIGERGESLRIK